jgi:N-glycosylase/DNA lyase
MKAASRRARPFADWLTEQRNGHAAAELSEALNDLIEAVAQFGKSGSLTFTVKLTPVASGDVKSVLVSDLITLKAPVGARAESVFFVDGDSNLTRENPMSPSLPLREVPRPVDEELREAR